MIESFRHKGLRRLFEDDDRKALSPQLVERIRLILFTLDQARSVDALDLPTFKLHELKGDRKGCWSVTVRANWRIVFRFHGEMASDVDLVDYH